MQEFRTWPRLFVSRPPHNMISSLTYSVTAPPLPTDVRFDGVEGHTVLFLTYMNEAILTKMFQAKYQALDLQVLLPLPLQPRSNVQDVCLQEQVQKSRIIKEYDKV